MSDGERCRNCDAMLAEGAEWCNQCFTRVDASVVPPEPEPEPVVPDGFLASPEEKAALTVAPPTSVEAIVGTELTPPTEVLATAPIEGDTGAVAQADDIESKLQWACPACGSENPLSLTLCSTCGTPFGKLFEEKSQIDMDPSRAARLGLVPGLAMIKMGEDLEGVIRMFAAALTWLTALFFISPGGNMAIRIVILLLYIGFLTLLIVESSLSSRRLAEGGTMIVKGRYLMYVFGAIFGISAILVIIAGTAARNSIQ